MKVELVVGNRYKWRTEDNSDFIVDKIEGNLVHYTYVSDKCPATGYITGTWFDEAELVQEQVLTKEDVVKAPSHYTNTKISALNVIDDWGLDFRLGNTIKYIKRYKLKGKPLEDLEKASTYLNFAIQKLKDEQNEQIK